MKNDARPKKGGARPALVQSGIVSKNTTTITTMNAILKLAFFIGRDWTSKKIGIVFILALLSQGI